MTTKNKNLTAADVVALIHEEAAQLEVSIDVTQATQLVRDNATVLSTALIPEASKLMQEMVKSLFTTFAEAIKSKPSQGEALKSIATIIGIPAAVATVETTVERALRRFCSPKQAILPLLVAGEAGSGKTWGGRAHAKNKSFDTAIEVGCLPDMEARDFIGGQQPVGKEFVYKYGPVGRAFRDAAAGKAVFLFIDEIFRAPARQRSMFLTALTPMFNEKGVAVYRLVTDKPVKNNNGEYADETIEAPVSNLSIFATTNIGAAYDVEDDDPAGKERWHRIYLKCEEADVRRAVSAWATARKFASATVDNLVKFFAAGRVMHTDGFLHMAPSTRMICRAVQIAESESDQHLVDALREVGSIWFQCGADGMPIKEQQDMLTVQLLKIWKAAK